MFDEIHEKGGHHLGDDDADRLGMLPTQVDGQFVSLVSQSISRLHDTPHGFGVHVMAIARQRP